ncbi:3-dehydroquinate synthase [Flavobacteriaceae bacterium M23B6Z8]
MPETIQTSGSPIYFNSVDYNEINDHIESKSYSKIFILVDENTHQYCLPGFLGGLTSDLPLEIIEIESGEVHKTLETCEGVWMALSELGADRKSLLINLGGGVVTDLGGFVAATFMRGIDFINIPSSLLAMVDASVGGKTGVDLGALKNQVGVIKLPQMVFINVGFLETLPENQLKSGLSEMLKHGLIFNSDHWNKLSSFSQFDANEMETLIHESVAIKNTIVTEDPTEKGLRKILNFGHTLGHAIESYFLENPYKSSLLHGEAIAIGMVLESYLSHKLTGLEIKELEVIKDRIAQNFDKVSFTEDEISKIIELLKFDKKNTFGEINFVLLNKISEATIDCKVSNELIKKSFAFYSQ